MVLFFIYFYLDLNLLNAHDIIVSKVYKVIQINSRQPGFADIIWQQDNPNREIYCKVKHG